MDCWGYHTWCNFYTCWHVTRLGVPILQNWETQRRIQFADWDKVRRNHHTQSCRQCYKIMPWYCIIMSYIILETLTLPCVGSSMFRLHIGCCGASPRPTLGSLMKATRPTGSWLLSRIRTTQGRRFSRKPWKFTYSWSPDLVTGTRFPPISMYCGLPSSTCGTNMFVSNIDYREPCNQRLCTSAVCMWSSPERHLSS